jgi:hypothetical protein
MAKEGSAADNVARQVLRVVENSHNFPGLFHAFLWSYHSAKLLTTLGGSSKVALLPDTYWLEKVFRQPYFLHLAAGATVYGVFSEGVYDEQ